MSAPDGPGALSGLRVLIVEDHYHIAEDMRRAVDALGGTVIGPAASLDAARRLLDDHAPDLAVLDINLGEEYVWSIAQRLREHGTPLIFATGYDKSRSDPRFVSELHLDKPVTAKVLSAAVERLPHAKGKS